LNADEQLGMMRSNNYLHQKGDTLWFRVGKKDNSGNATYDLRYVASSIGNIQILQNVLPDRFKTNFLFSQPNIYYPYFNGDKIYYFDELIGKEAQLFQYTISEGSSKKLVPPDNPTEKFQSIIDVLQLENKLLIKANYKGPTGIVIKSFFYYM
jgi:hypothetical protein